MMFKKKIIKRAHLEKLYRRLELNEKGEKKNDSKMFYE